MEKRIVWGTLAAAVLVLALKPGCRPGPAAHPEAPARAEVQGDDEPVAAARPAPEEAEVLVGRFCPKAARGRPAVEPLFALAEDWHADEDWLSRLIASGAARQIAALGWDGRRVGVMTASGAAEGGGRPLLVGSYFGSSPCASDAPLGEEPEDDPACLRALGGCGVAVAALEKPAGLGARPFGEDGDPMSLEPRSACATADQLVIDLHGGGPVGFSLEGFDADSPPEELFAVSGEPAACEPSFASEVTSGGARVDILAVADLDGSGRADVVLAVGEGAERRWVLYSASRTPVRLDRVAIASAPAPEAEDVSPAELEPDLVTP